jgi:hypothetical protein
LLGFDAPFFDPGPVVLEPSLDGFIISLGGTRLRDLAAPVQFVQQAVEIMGMVHYAKLAFNQPPDAPQGPPFGAKASGSRTALQLAQQHPLLRSCELGRTAGRLVGAQTTQTTRTEACGPLTDRSTTYSESARNLGSSQMVFSEQASTSQAAFFHLLASQPFRFPCHDSQL